MNTRARFSETDASATSKRGCGPDALRPHFPRAGAIYSAGATVWPKAVTVRAATSGHGAAQMSAWKTSTSMSPS